MAFATVTPIASGDAHLVPEALFISALVDSGQYMPDLYKVEDRHFSAHKQVHEYCKQVQADSGKAPTVNLLRRKFKTFPYLEGQADHAKHHARVMKENWRARVLRRGVGEFIMEINSPDVDINAAAAALALEIEGSTISSNSYATMTDIDLFDDEGEDAACPVSINAGDNLTRFAGMIKPGNLWYVVARMGVGKSWTLAIAAIAAAEAGWDVWFYSTEMTRKEVLDRLHQVALRDSYRGRWKELSKQQRGELVDQWQATAGRIFIVTAEDGPLDASVIAGNHTEGSIAVVDYIGHMNTSAGRPAAEDHSIIAQISIELKRTALAHRIPILCAAQMNREGASAGERAGTKHVAGSDQLARDADVMLTVMDMDPDIQTRVRIFSLTKNRHGSGGHKWFVLYDFEDRDFRDLSYDQANSIKEADLTAKSIGI